MTQQLRVTGGRRTTCPNGGSMTGIQGATQLWSTNWDWGDGVIYPKVYMSQNTTINANLYCAGANGRPGMYVYAINRTFPATGDNQTICSDQLKERIGQDQ